MQNIHAKIKTFFSDAARCFDNLSKTSRLLLIIGQLFILCALIAFTLYIVYIRDSKNIEIFADTFYTAKIFFDNAIAGLSVLWGGALFIDYLEKKNKV